MKKQSGFTLIELLLVLAIIGIISAIAIPALLGQRARARDKSSIANLDGVIADGIGLWDKNRETLTGSAAMTAVATALKNAHSTDKNPWDSTATAYVDMSTGVNGAATTSAFLAGMAGGAVGQVVLKGAYPGGSLPGFIGGAVLLHSAYNGSTTYKKAAAVE